MADAQNTTLVTSSDQPNESFLVLLCDQSGSTTEPPMRVEAEDVTEFCSAKLIEENPELMEEDPEDASPDKAMTDNAIRLLIYTYTKLFVTRKPGVKKKQIWQEVHEEFKAKGYAYKPTQLLNKWRTLERGLKRVVSRKGRKEKGRGVITCAYQRQLEEVLAKCPEIFPDCITVRRKNKPKVDSRTTAEFRSTGIKDEDGEDSGNSSRADSEDDDERPNIERTSVEMDSNSNMSATSQSSNNSLCTQKPTNVAQELAKLRNTVKMCIEEEDKLKQLHHEEKMKLLHEILDVPTMQKIIKSDRPIRRCRK